jgi:hypothetical protein
MNFNLIFETNFFFFVIFSATGFIIGYFIYNLVIKRNKNTAKIIAPLPLPIESNIINSTEDIPVEIDTDILASIEDIIETINGNTLDLIEDITDSSSETSEDNISDTQSISDVQSVSDTQSISDVQSISEYGTNISDGTFTLSNFPDYIIQDFKIEEINELYSNEILQYGITSAELREIIELFPILDLYSNDINHLILTIMSYYHF